MRRPVSRLIALVSVLTLTLGISALRSPAAMAAATCTTTATANYSVQVCLSAPAAGATLTGDTTVTATQTMVHGSQSVSRLAFTVDGQYLLSAFTSPYSFTWHSARHWTDGSHTLGVYAVMSDGSTTENNPAPGGPATESVVLSNGVTTTPTNGNSFTVATGSSPPAGQPEIVGTVGSGADGRGANLVAGEIAGWSPNLFLYLGDVYERGSYEEFDNWYDPSWGAMRGITNPVPGDQETYYGMVGYGWYWNNLPAYYSYDVAGWHFIALTQCAWSSNSFPPNGLCGGTSAELSWLNSDLAAHPGACTIAYWHEPRFALDGTGGSTTEQPLWSPLANSHATMAINADRHNYERWTAMDANGTASATGMAEFVVGTGNHNWEPISGSDSRVVKAIVNTPGAVKLSLTATTAGFQFIGTDGTVGDSGNIPCQGNGTLAGTVTDAGSGAPIAGASVSYSGTGPAGPVSGSATTDGAGHYSIGGIAVTSYSMTAQTGGYQSQSATATVGGGSTTTQNFALTSQATTLTGTVTDASTARPIPGATVSAGTSNATTNGSGVYSISGLAPGAYTATTTATGYASQSASVTMTAGATTTQNFALAPNPGTITGTVTDSGSTAPIAGATVSYGGGSTTTDGSGSYTLANVAEGSYTVTASATGYAGQSRTVTVGPGATATQNFALTPPNGAITGTVTNATTGTPISGATVAYSGGSTTTNGSGQYTLSSVSPGTYSVTASASGYSSMTQSVTVGSGQTATANFGLRLAPLFGDGFESGNLSSWTSSAGLTVQSATVHSGTYAAEGSTVNGTTYAIKHMSSTYSDLYYRTYVDLKSQTTGFTLMGDQTASGGGIIRLYVSPQSQLVLWNDVTQLTTTGPTLSLGTWHSVELHVVINGALSTTEVWLDGALVPAFSSTMATLGVMPVGQIQLGNQGALQIYDVALDDVAVSTSRIGQ
ncbi:MAG: large repetitive protein [Chloroflexota bacterium]|jgi:hypothetical protein|nr:large repetitive protein [Chloroflexota bacterium]